jgi:hypothetical protein
MITNGCGQSRQVSATVTVQAVQRLRPRLARGAAGAAAGAVPVRPRRPMTVTVSLWQADGGRTAAAGLTAGRRRPARLRRDRGPGPCRGVAGGSLSHAETGSSG